jgi:hypothetical protein
MLQQNTQLEKRRGRPKGVTLTVAQKLLCDLSLVDYATRDQLARLLGMERCHTYIRETLSNLTAAGFVLCLAGSGVTMPHVYTLTRKGREYANLLLGTISQTVPAVRRAGQSAQSLFYAAYPCGQ